MSLLSFSSDDGWGPDLEEAWEQYCDLHDRYNAVLRALWALKLTADRELYALLHDRLNSLVMELMDDIDYAINEAN